MTLTLAIPKHRKVTLLSSAPVKKALPPVSTVSSPAVTPSKPLESLRSPQAVERTAEPEQSPQRAVQSPVQTPPTFNELESFLREITPDYDPDGEPLHRAYFRRQQREADLLEQISNGRIQPEQDYTRPGLLSILSKTPGKHKAWAIEGLRVLEELGLLQVDSQKKTYRLKSNNE
jgi:hypothetical protein